jgi:fatty acid synthase
LVARPFELTREFAKSILDVAPSEPVQALLDDAVSWDELAKTPGKLARLLLIELLSWQFASPVRWIETQQLLFTSTTLTTQGGTGIGVEHYVEIGLGSAPTLANLAAKTLTRDEFASVSVAVHNLGRDESRVYYTDTDPAVQIKGDDDDDSAASSSDSAPKDLSQSATPAAAPPVAVAAAAPVAPAAAPVAPAPAAGGSRPADLAFKADDGIKVLIAYANKVRLDQIGDADTTETLTNGVSSRRNQLLMDLSAELGLASIDGAADATIKALSELVNKLAHSYKPFGPVVNEAIRDRVRKHLGAGGGKISRIASRVADTWGLEAGWIAHVTSEILLGTREGASVRGGDLATLAIAPPANASEVDALIDTAVAAVATRFGVAVTPLGAGGGTGGAAVDSAALDAFAEQITGEAGILAATARTVLEQLGLSHKGQVGVLPGVDEDARAQRAIVEAVTQELGANWPKLVAPAFEAAKVVELDDRWASAREDLATLFVTGELPYKDVESHFAGLGKAVADQASWWADKAFAAGNKTLAGVFEAIAAAALTPIDPTGAQARFAADIAVVTGAAPRSIGAAVVAGLLSGGAAVIATSSRVDSERLAFFKDLYRTHASGGAKLWVVPANMSSYRDIDALAQWIGSEQRETVGGETKLIKEALVPTLFFPFAAPRVHGTLKDAGAASENQMRLLLWSVERSIAGLSNIGIDTHVNHRLHVILPGSPNRGIFGGDGAYGEVKAAFDAIATRWQVEPIWSDRVSIAHPRIGWVRGTGLMSGNDPLVDAVERVGVRTYSTDEIAAELLALSTLEARRLAAIAPLDVDLTGGLGDGGIDLVALKQQAAADAAATSGARVNESSAVARVTIPALPTPVQPCLAPSHVEQWGDVTLPLKDMNVVVGFGEVSTWGSSRTRLEAELGMQRDGKVELTAAGVLELAWMMGLVEWQETPVATWVDKEGGEVPEAEIYQRYRDEVVARCGIREFVDLKPLVKLGYEQDVAVFLDKDITFQVASEEAAYSFIEIDPEHTIVRFDEDSSEWEVTRLKGSQARVPRKATLTRQVGGQLPTNFDPANWGIPASMIDSLDSFAVWNLVTAVDAFLSSGFSPAELLQAVHPSEVADTQGTGIGGTESMRKLFVDGFLGEDRPQDILQEALPNVLAAHVMQSFVGGYGSMIHPVAACATAAVSIEDACDKIKAGKAQFVVAGAIDDISVESIQGFGDMNATAKTSDMRARGISDRFFSRANDRRRGGFVEAQGGGTVLITRGDIALELGLPVLGVIGYSRSFADGAHTSIPAPGLGALGAGRGGRKSAFVRQLAALGVSPDDISVVSKHDTSTNANDPNESELYTRLSAAIGRKPGNPLFVISQKTITGHAKGGASVFQTAGLCQLFTTGIIPANRALDCVAPEFRTHAPIVWLREPLALGKATQIKAGLLTSLGFGHVSAMIAVVNPTAFEVAVANEVGDSALAAWRARATGRLRDGAKRRESGMLGHASLYEPIESRRFGKKTSSYDPHEVEAELLLNPEARLGVDGLYA